MKAEGCVTLSLKAMVVQEIISALAFQNRYLRKNQPTIKVKESSVYLSTSDITDQIQSQNYTDSHIQDHVTATRENSDLNSKC